MVPLSCLIPSKTITESMRKSVKYKTIESTINISGILQPLAIYPCREDGPNKGKFKILDGHLRWEILNKLNMMEVECIISTDDEGYTYNHKVNRLSVIQEHFMIVKVLDAGVEEERLALALNVDIANIKKQRKLLNDICPEAVEILKDKNIAASTLILLRKVKPVRQVYICTLMKNSNNYSQAFMKALIITTPEDLCTTSRKGNKSKESIDAIQTQLELMEKNIKPIGENYRDSVYKFMLARKYIERLMRNAKIVRYLALNHNDIFTIFNKALTITIHDA